MPPLRFATDQIRVFYEDWYRFDPSRAQRSFHLRSFLLTFAAELTLYEKGTKLAKLIAMLLIRRPVLKKIRLADFASSIRARGIWPVFLPESNICCGLKKPFSPDKRPRHWDVSGFGTR
jgi:hypothetical protein